MSNHTHGVAEIDFGDMNAAIGADHQIDTQRPTITREDVIV